MDLRQLRYFTAVVENGSISAAAKKLHISQPPLSTQLRLLEEELNVRLFERGARRVTLTEAGRLLYQRAQELLELQALTRDELQSFRTGRKGNLRIGLVSTCRTEVLTSVLCRYHTLYPEIAFEVFEGNTYELQEMMEFGRIDLAVIRTPFHSAGYDLISLEEDPLLAIASKEFLQDLPPEITLADLCGRPLLIYRRREAILRAAFERIGQEPIFAAVNDSAWTTVSWAELGLGIALVPASTSYRGTLEVRRLTDPDMMSTLMLIKKRGRVIAHSAALLFDLFSGEPV